MIKTTLYYVTIFTVSSLTFIEQCTAQQTLIPGSYSSNIKGERLDIIANSDSSENLSQYRYEIISGCNTVADTVRFLLPPNYSGIQITAASIVPNPVTFYCGGATFIVHIVGLTQAFRQDSATKITEIAGKVAGSRNEVFHKMNIIHESDARLPTKK